MTCSLYAGTLVYHPNCTKGYSYYHNDCCNHKWYIAWNVLLFIALAACIALSCVGYRRYKSQKVEKKKAMLVAYQSEQDEQVKRDSEGSLRYSVPANDAVLMRAPKAFVESDLRPSQVLRSEDKDRAELDLLID